MTQTTTATEYRARLVGVAEAQPTATLIATATRLDGLADRNADETLVLHTIFAVVEARYELVGLMTEIAGAEDFQGSYTDALVLALATQQVAA